MRMLITFFRFRPLWPYWCLCCYTYAYIAVYQQYFENGTLGPTDNADNQIWFPINLSICHKANICLHQTEKNRAQTNIDHKYSVRMHTIHMRYFEKKKKCWKQYCATISKAISTGNRTKTMKWKSRGWQWYDIVGNDLNVMERWESYIYSSHR